MTRSKCLTILVVLATVLLAAGLATGLPQDAAQNVSPADTLFRAGRFDEAGRLYAQAAEKDPASYGDMFRDWPGFISSATPWMKRKPG